ncbi:MAG TPA: putative toxin-antitoxin system toxin component, PIN family [Planctomycetota bacterium]|nr:putative toxin-antitoxin system toxin component, PIN family [Planctomycetota bacterium]
MSAELRFVFDTNVSVSAAILKDSAPDLALTKALALGTLVMSADTLAELEEVLHRPKFSRYLDDDERDLFVSKLVAQASLVDVTVAIKASHDPKDNKFLELAVSAQATHIVTGDNDLLVLNPFQGIAILTPHQFLAQFHTTRGPSAE